MQPITETPSPVSTAPPAPALPSLAEFQIALERLHFSCGFIDGEGGERTERTIAAFQRSRGLPITGQTDAATWQALHPQEPLFTTYVLTQKDFDHVIEAPATWREKSEASTLDYNTIWELLAARFHSKRSYLQQLNPGVTTPQVGSTLHVPNLQPSPAPIVADSIRINLGQRWIEPLDASGKALAHFPCSIAKDKDKRPSGRLSVQVIVPHPNYTFDPALFADAAAREGITEKLIIPPGPRNPVGTVWIGLSLPGYGIHGTPDPEAVGRTGSHGCFRLANWNAEALLPMVRVGMPVEVE